MRVDAPAAAVMVTDVAFVVCQFNVTLCPELIELELAEKVRAGLVALLRPLQHHNESKAAEVTAGAIQRQSFVIIG